MNTAGLKLATRWEVKEVNGERSIQLFDANGSPLDGHEAYWEGGFYCDNNQLTSLQGGPSSVGWGFDCSYNHLTSLQGAPSTVGSWFNCSDNPLTSLQGAPIKNDPNVNEKLFEAFLDHGYVFADGIMTQYLWHEHLKDGIDLYTTSEIMSGEVVFVATNGQHYAHGDTQRDALLDLRFKTSDRDTSQFKKLKLTKKYPLEDLIFAYRCITGACERGVKRFTNSNELPNTLTIPMAVKLTQGQYRSDIFKNFFYGEG